MYIPMYKSVSALRNQGPKPWVNETILGAGADVCLNVLACGPMFDTKEGGNPRNVRENVRGEPSL